MSLFDETGKLVDRDALRSVSFNGQGMRVPATYVDRKSDTKIVEAIHEDDGSTAGYSTYHGSGRVDANVFARAAKIDQSEGT